MTQFETIAGVKTATRNEGKGNDVILLHGWGQNMEMMEKIEDHLKSDFHVYTFDFPGFGESDPPQTPWGVNDYEHFLEEYVRVHDIQHPILIAHSFGARVAIRYAVDHNDVCKMCLTGAAGIRAPQSFAAKLRQRGFKIAKWFLSAIGDQRKIDELRNKYSAEDYKNAKGVMKPTFVKVVNDDVTPVLKNVRCSVLLVWGDQDLAAPLWMGKKMEQEMPAAGLAIFKGDDHFAYYHQSERFNQVLDIFLKEDKEKSE